MPLALALATTFGLWLGLVRSARADGLLFQHTIPREVDAYDFTTGGPFMAPPVPYGHYAKDYVDEAHKAVGCVTCKLHALMGGAGAGHGLFHHGSGDGGCGHGHGKGCGHGAGGGGGGSGLECGSGHGLFGHQGGSPFGSGCLGHLHGGGGGGLYGETAGFATTWAESSGQATVSPSTQSICGQPGCNVTAKHSHLGHLLGQHGHGETGLCDDRGCGVGGKHGHGGGYGTGCELCGGKGCGNCLSGLKSGLGMGLGGLHGKLASLTGVFHKPKVSWFLGAGGPVPLTPGYVPYIVVTRSPRDFFAFPPMNPNDP